MKKVVASFFTFILFVASCDIDPPDQFAAIQMTEPGTNGAPNPENDQQFTYGNTAYNGMETAPINGYFKSDAFFMIKGWIISTNPAYQYSWIRVTKDGTELRTGYWVRGNFLKRIWLRFGPGNYTVEVLKTRVLEPNLDYEGDIIKWEYLTPAAYTFHVTNTNAEDGSFFYPSDFVQSDDPAIMSLSSTILQNANPGDDYSRIERIHDYVAKSLYYDNDSLAPGRRKKQDALSALANRTAVCEGYTSLYNALLRASGIRTKCIFGYAGAPENKHAWSQVRWDPYGSWFYSDVTWDDAIDPYTMHNDYPDGSNITHKYFLKPDPLQDHVILDERPERSIIVNQLSAFNQTWIGYPEGVY